MERGRMLKPIYNREEEERARDRNQFYWSFIYCVVVFIFGIIILGLIGWLVYLTWLSQNGDDDPITKLLNAISPGSNEASLINDGIGPTLVERIISGGNFTIVTFDDNKVYIDPDVQAIAQQINITACCNNATLNFTLNVTLQDSDNPEANEASLIKDGQGPNLVEKILSGGNFTIITNDTNRVFIDVDALAIIDLVVVNNTLITFLNDTLTPGANEASWINDGVGPILFEKIVSGGDFVLITSNSSKVFVDVDIQSVSDYVCNNCTLNVTLEDTLEPDVNEASLINDGIGPNLIEKIISGSSFVIVSSDSDKVYIDIDAGAITDLVVVNNSVVTFLDDTVAPGANEASLIGDGIGPSLEEKILSGGGFTIITNDTNKVFVDVDIQAVSDFVCNNCTFNVTLVDSDATSTNEASLIKDGQGPNMIEKILSGGNFTLISNDSNRVYINVDGSAIADLVTSNGSLLTFLDDTVAPGANEASLIFDGVGPNLIEKIVSGGSNIIISSDSDKVYFDVDVPSVLSQINVTNITLQDTTSPGFNEASLIFDGLGPNLFEKIISGGNFTIVTFDSDKVYVDVDIQTVINVVDPTQCCQNITLEDTVTPGVNEASLIFDGLGPNLVEKIISGGNFTIVTFDSDKVYIDADIQSILAEVNTSSTCCNNTINITLEDAVAPGFNEASLINDGLGPNLFEKIISGGNFTTVTTDSNKVYIDVDIQTVINVVDPTQCCQNVTLSNAKSPGAGEKGLTADGQGPDLTIKVLKEGSGIDLNSTSDTVTISCNCAVTPTIVSSTSIGPPVTTHTATCSVGVLSGGGCFAPAVPLSSSYPSSTTVWTCITTVATAITAFAICV